MNKKVPLDRLTAYAIRMFAHTTTTRNRPDAMSEEAFEGHRKKVRAFLIEDLPTLGSGDSIAERFYNRFSPLASSKSYSGRSDEDKAYWDNAAKDFLNEVVRELEFSEPG